MRALDNTVEIEDADEGKNKSERKMEMMISKKKGRKSRQMAMRNEGVILSSKSNVVPILVAVQCY